MGARKLLQKYFTYEVSSDEKKEQEAKAQNGTFPSPLH